MKLIICDSKQMHFFQLPEHIKEYYIVNYEYNGLFESINLLAENNQWMIVSDRIIRVMQNGATIDKAPLREYSNFVVHLNDLNMDIALYIVPDFENYVANDVRNLAQITIGSAGCNINYRGIPGNVTCATISINGDQKVITKNEGSNVNIYINKNILTSHNLNLGDVIFVNGLKMIWMGNHIKINNPNNLVSFNGLNPYMDKPMIKYNFTPITESERNAKLYTDSNVFFHTPRLKSSIKDEEIRLDPPPEKDNSAQIPMVLTIGSSAIIGITSCVTGVSAVHGLISGTTTVFEAVLEFIMSFLMLTACVVFPLLTNMWQKKQKKKQENRRQERYRNYLNKKQDEINNIIASQEKILHENYLSLDEIEKRIKNNSNSVWSREILDDDFLTLRLGLGDLPAKLKINAPAEAFNLFDDDLRDEVLKISTSEHLTKNVPVTISMTKNKITPFIFGASYRDNYINSLMLQIMYYHSSMDLKLVILTNKENLSNWEYLKCTPYVFSNDYEKRFFSTNESEVFQISMYLEQEYDKRFRKVRDYGSDDLLKVEPSELYKNFQEYYLIITDDFKEVKNAPIIERILNSMNNLGFSIMIFESKISNLPNRLEKFVDIENNVSGIYSHTMTDEGQTTFKAEYKELNNIMEYSNILANIPIQSKTNSYAIPTFLPFLDMYGVGNISQLNVLSRWADNSPINSLNAQVGIKNGNKPIGLDLHEKFHGPHGLIAGSTGSGKSEFIITYILSMAINYHPQEVQFVLIDYKGGGLTGAFENRETGVRLPHIVGTITNLDTSEMNRSLVSIKSELTRRQKIFNEARDMLGEGTIDIYKYQRLYREGKVKEPVAHLFVISDEFAELKREQPDFMDELVSTARIGRSLGVHLILATQKPSGIVDDQIWSNSRFKVCLKVQTTEDSLEMLKRPEASEIKETGRFYLQVGNNELFELGQSAWAGAKYVETNRYIKKIDDSIDFISDDGVIYKRINDDVKDMNQVDKGEQVNNIVNYLYNIAISEQIPFKSLWLPSLPKDIYLGNLVKKYNYHQKPYQIEPIIGEFDKPAEQRQGLFTLNLNCKNSIIYGIPGSGKENLLETIMYSSCTNHTTDEVAFYILDFGSGALNSFSKMPHVGDIATSFEKEKVASTFDYLNKEIRRRKELFADYNGDYNLYCEKSGNTVPLIITVLNGYESFMENCGEYDDFYVHLLRDGSKYGITFIMSVVSTNSVRTTVLEYFANKILLQVPEKFDYQFMLNAPRGMEPAKIYGRGMALIEDEACEFQTAYIYLKESISDIIRDTSIKLSTHYHQKVPNIRTLPSVVKLDKLLKFTKNISRIPIGYTLDTVELIYYNFLADKTHLIVGNTVVDDTTFMASIIDLIDSLPDVKLNLFDLMSSVNTDGNLSYYNINYEEPFKEILNNYAPKLTVNIFLSIGNYKTSFDEEEQKLFETIVNNISKLNNQIFIFIDNTSRIHKISGEAWYQNLNHNAGMWYGSDVDTQDVIKIGHLHNYDIIDDAKDIVYIVDKGDYCVVKCVGDERGRY